MKKKIFVFILAFAIAPLLYLLIVWKKVPPVVALHFDLNGNVDRFGDKKELWIAGSLIGLVTLLVYLLLINIHRFDPKKQAAENKTRIQSMAIAVSIFMTVVNFVLLNSSITGTVTTGITLILAGVGLLFAVIGNYMPNLKPNYFAGFRLPWTLENPDNWKKTHALAGRVWFVGGLAMAVIILFLSPLAALVFFLAGVLIITLVPAVFSYRLYKKNKNSFY